MWTSRRKSHGIKALKGMKEPARLVPGEDVPAGEWPRKGDGEEADGAGLLDAGMWLFLDEGKASCTGPGRGVGWAALTAGRTA